MILTLADAILLALLEKKSKHAEMKSVIVID
jgi:hypothetical protein